MKVRRFTGSGSSHCPATTGAAVSLFSWLWAIGVIVVATAASDGAAASTVPDNQKKDAYNNINININYNSYYNTFFTYYDEVGGLGPSQWANLALHSNDNDNKNHNPASEWWSDNNDHVDSSDKNKEWNGLMRTVNQCGGTHGWSGYGQSPVTIDTTTSQACHGNVHSKYRELQSGNCQWTDLQFVLTNYGVKILRKPTANCTLGQMTMAPSDENDYDNNNYDDDSGTFEAVELHIHSHSEHSIVGHPQSIGQSGFFPAELQVLHRRRQPSNQEEEDAKVSFVMWAVLITAASNQPNDYHDQFEWMLQGWEAVAMQVAQQCQQNTTNTTTKTTKSRPRTNLPLQCTPVNAEYPYKVTNLPFPNNNINNNNGIVSPRNSQNVPTDWRRAPNLYQLPQQQQQQQVDGEQDFIDYGMYTYKGSFTTPNCAEHVHWNIVDRPMTISESQLARLEYLILCYVRQFPQNDDDNNNNNNSNQEPTTAPPPYDCQHATVASPATGSTSRPPQPLEGRHVLHRCWKNGPPKNPKDVGVQKQPQPESSSKPTATKVGDNSSLLVSSDPLQSAHPKVAEEEVADNNNNSKDYGKVWNQYQGYFVGTIKYMDGDMNPLTESFASRRVWNTLPYPRQEVAVFINRTIRGTRYYETMYQIYQPVNNNNKNNTTFCSFSLPEHASNVLGAGEPGQPQPRCGVHGYARVGQRFGIAAATPAKQDYHRFVNHHGGTLGTMKAPGRYLIFATNGLFANPPLAAGGASRTIAGCVSAFVPLNNSSNQSLISHYMRIGDGNGASIIQAQEVNRIEPDTEEKRNVRRSDDQQYGIKIIGFGTYTVQSPFPPPPGEAGSQLAPKVPILHYYSVSVRRVNVDEFVEDLNQAYTDNNVLESDQIPIIRSGHCVSVRSGREYEDDITCPTQEDFNQLDPRFKGATLLKCGSSSKRLRLSVGWIAFFVFSGILILSIAVSWILYDLDQMKRWHDHHHTTLDPSGRSSGSSHGTFPNEELLHQQHQQLDPIALEKVFNRLDKDRDGLVTRQELIKFLTRGKMMMSTKTFNALFEAVIQDADRITETFLNFDQFLAFMTLYARPRLVLCMMKKRRRRSALAPIAHGLYLLVQKARINQGLLVVPRNKRRTEQMPQERVPFVASSSNNSSSYHNNKVLRETDRHWTDFQAASSGSLV
ncbi:hypothetical protein ACA910_005363 [Epithemia clementina (nom. ined.)]